VLMTPRLRFSVIEVQRHSVTELRQSGVMEIKPITIGDRIRLRRKQLKRTQGDVAKASGLATSTISDLENHYQDSTTEIHSVAATLGVRVEWLATGEEPMLPTAGVRQEAPRYHGVLVSEEGARLGAEWDKIEGEEYRKLARELIESLVAAQKREARVKPTPLVSKAKSKHQRHSLRART
jgi:transcriptional regulator with XRE-family HTH domain